MTTVLDLKAKQRATWASGDYSVIGTTLQAVGENLCEAVDLSAGCTVLDVAAGNGNASLAAARRGCRVTASDYVPELLAQAGARAAADGLVLDLREADAEELPFATASFDAVLSTFGVMFAPQQDRAAAELVRVCRPGGRIGLASWTPTGFIGQMFKVVGGHVPPPPGVPSPLRWGTDEVLQELLGTRVRELRVERRHFVFRYRSPEDWIGTFRTYYGPTLRAFAALDEEGQQSLTTELTALAASCDTATDGTLRIPSEYLEVVATV